MPQPAAGSRPASCARGKPHLTHFGPELNRFKDIKALFRTYSECGRGRIRTHIHTEEEAATHNQKLGTFTPWVEIPEGTDMLFYGRLHGGVTDKVNVAGHTDLLMVSCRSSIWALWFMPLFNAADRRAP